MTKNKTIILDIDDTIADLKSLLCKEINEHTGENIPCDEWKSFYITNIYKTIDLPTFYDIIIKNKVLERIKPYDSTKSTMDMLYNLGYNLVLISSRSYHPNAYELTENWLNEHKLPFDHLHISGDIKKSEFANRYQHVILSVDDNLDNNEDYRKHSNNESVLLMDQPWNRLNKDYPRINRIDEILNLEQLTYF